MSLWPYYIPMLTKSTPYNTQHCPATMLFNESLIRRKLSLKKAGLPSWSLSRKALDTFSRNLRVSPEHRLESNFLQSIKTSFVEYNRKRKKSTEIHLFLSFHSPLSSCCISSSLNVELSLINTHIHTSYEWLYRTKSRSTTGLKQYHCLSVIL